MEIQHDGKTSQYNDADDRTLIVGRSARADYLLDEVGASNTHVEVRAGPNGLQVRDCSLNGTGYLDETGALVRMAKGAVTFLGPEVRLVIPYAKPGGGKNNDYEDRVHRIRCWSAEPDRARGTVPLPLHDTQGGKDDEFPTTWPRSWATLPLVLKQAWADEGIEDAQDLSGFYSTSRRS